jgi:hypothetical protein
VKIIGLEDQLLLTLMKLRVNLPYFDLAMKFGISEATCTNVFNTILHALHELFFKSLLCQSVPTLAKIHSSMPECCLLYTNCRQIWDCTDIFIASPRSDLLAQRSTYSTYRGGYTLKGLVCISPNGAIVWMSDLFPGGISDKDIVQKCGILSTLNAGDLILADKGFLISCIMPPGVSVNIPSFLDSQTKQFTRQQITWSRNISRFRIHVERAIQRLKEFDILKCLPAQHRCIAHIIFQVCGTLVNMQYPLLKDN